MVAVGYFAARKAEVKHQGYLLPEGFADACDFSTSLFEKLGVPSSISRQTLEKLFTILYNLLSGERALRADVVHDL